MKKEAKSLSYLNCFEWNRINLFRILGTVVLLIVAVIGSCGIFIVLTEQEANIANSEFVSYKRLLEVSVTTILNHDRHSSHAVSYIYSHHCPTDDNWPECYMDTTQLTLVSQHIFSGEGIAYGVFITPEQQAAVEQGFYERHTDIDVGNSSFGKGIYGLSPLVDADDYRYHIVNGSFGIRLLAPVIQMTAIDQIGKFLALYDEYSEIVRHRALNELLEISQRRASNDPATVLSDVITFPEALLTPPRRDGVSTASLLKCIQFTAVKPKNSSNSTVARGYILKPITWTNVLSNIVPENVPGIRVMLTINSTAYEFDIKKSQAVYRRSRKTGGKEQGNCIDIFDGSIKLFLSVKTTDEFYDHYRSENPVYAVVVFVIMIVVISVVFFAYDQFVNQQILRKEIILQTKQLFVRYISHEIRTPLNTVCIGIGLVFDEMRAVLQEGGLSSSHLEMLRHWNDIVFSISESSSAAVQVLNDLLDYEQIEISKLNMDVTVFSLYDSLYTVFKSFEHQLNAKNITASLMSDVEATLVIGGNGVLCSRQMIDSNSFTTMATTDCALSANLSEPDVEMPVDKSKIVVEGDCKKIEQVIRNFMSNAIKFTPVGGNIVLSVTWVKKTGSKYNGRTITSPGGLMRVSCTDNGVGLTKEQLGKLFTEGVQFDANRLQDGKGSGLGLMICKGIIEEHRGALYAQSDGPGSGCKFVFEVPATYDETFKRTIQEVAKSSQQLASRICLSAPDSVKRILICDDSVASVKLVKRLLINSGF